MKRITIDVVSDGVVVKRVSSPLISTRIEGHFHAEEVCGVLLLAYQQAAEFFIAQHSPQCENCEAYKMHHYLLTRSKYMINEAVEKNRERPEE